MAKLIIKEGDRKRIYEICEDTLHIGSTPENNIRLRDADASRVHCEIKKTPQGYKIIDLESKVGTQVNGEHINQHVLQHGDRIQIGGALMQFHAGKSAAMNLQPQESVRMERARTQKGMNPAAIVGIGLGVVSLIVVMIMFFKQDTQLKGQVLVDRAEHFLAQFSPENTEKARQILKDYEDLPSNEKSVYTDKLFADRVKKLEANLRTIEEGKRNEIVEAERLKTNDRATELYNEGQIDQAIQLLQAFNAKYPNHNRTHHFNKTIARWEKKLAGGVGNPDEVIAKIKQLMDDEAYGEAKQLIETSARKWKRVDSVTEQLNSLYKEHGNRTVDAWKSRHREAQEYADEGNMRVATSIYQGVKRWGIDKYEKLADAELEKLKLRQ